MIQRSHFAQMSGPTPGRYLARASEIVIKRACSVVAGALLASPLITEGSDAGERPVKPSQEPPSILEAEDRPEPMLRLSPSVERAILAAGNGAKIAFISDATLQSMPKARLLIITVGIVPKSERSWESIIHKGFVVISRWQEGIAVYTLDPSKMSEAEFLERWMSDSNYRLPIGEGLTKVFESKPSQ